jgi:hypothetical protein
MSRFVVDASVGIKGFVPEIIKGVLMGSAIA